MSTTEPANLAWLDIETTGLDEHKDAILEIGVTITTKDLEQVNSLVQVVSPTKEVFLSTVDPYVLKMHADNGLWEECLSEKLPSLDYTIANFIAFIHENGATGSPMCGSTVSFDRAFIKAQCPKLLEAFHYRNIDVSVMKNLIKMYHPDVYASLPAGEKKHRTLSDLDDSIRELRHYVNNLGWKLP